MKILEQNRGIHILEQKNGYQIKLNVELLTDPGRWFIYNDSFTFWHKPENLPMTEKERLTIIRKIKDFYQDGLLVFEGDYNDK
ncbi:hypothetical protein LCGC14_1520340 [marine sediment metagenome]|uniref:Immunity protein 74 n=2 Tax=root TaxID=1 RepID=A0A831QNB9_9FLAO|nr:hypothetical protein [Pricia antarctica]